MEPISAAIVAAMIFIAGGAADQTVPTVHDFNKKYVVEAIHSTEQPWEKEGKAH